VTERVDVANICLSMLGEKPITSLDDNSSNAKQLTIQYVPARDATTEAYDWTFAIERFTPGLLTEVPVYGGSAYFAVPSNILRVISCDNVSNTSAYFSDPINSREQIDWQMEGGKILCNETVVYARGVRRVEDEGSFSELFVQAFAAKLAMLLAINLTASADIQARVTAYYDFAINEAISRDGQQGRATRFRSRRPARVR
jgi:hypothetical protein